MMKTPMKLRTNIALWLNKSLLLALTLMCSNTFAASEITGKLVGLTWDMGYRHYHMEQDVNICGIGTGLGVWLFTNATNIKFDPILRAAFHAGKTVTIKAQKLASSNQCSVLSVQTYQDSADLALKQ